MKFRPWSGSVRTSFSSTVCCTVDCTVSISGGAAVTVTLSSSDATFRRKSITRAWFAASDTCW